MSAGGGFEGKVREMTMDVVAVATGKEHRQDAVRPGTGGPAGNARLTAWTGLLLLALIGAELVTLLDVRGLISWHVAIGTLLLPPALLKTATTSWRVARYYAGSPHYREAGPPPTVLRLLGPVVVVSTLAVLGTGLLLIFLGPDTSRNGLALLGQRLDYVTVHQASFAVWAVATGLHILARIVPALQLTVVRGAGRRSVPGLPWRGTALVVTAVLAAVGAFLVVGSADDWKGDGGRGGGRPDGLPAGQALLR